MTPPRYLSVLMFIVCGVVTSNILASPLLDAASHGDLNKFKSLLESGANINVKSRGGWTVLHKAVWGGSGSLY